MVEYELELVRQHPALPAQNPLLTQPKPRTTSNTLKHCFMPQIQTVAEKIMVNLEHIKEIESEALYQWADNLYQKEEASKRTDKADT